MYIYIYTYIHKYTYVYIYKNAFRGLHLTSRRILQIIQVIPAV